MVTSTVPGAIQTLQGYMQTVAAANPSLNVGVYLGPPIGSIKDNFMAVGSYQDWAPVAPESYSWAALPGQAKRRTESYSLQATIRSYSGGVSEPLARLDEAFTLLNGLHQQILNDINGSGTLSPSGGWGALHVTMEAFGPLDGKGFGVVLALDLAVVSAEITG